MKMSRRDRISFLPNEIQDLIASHLPIEEALRTSILSTRWRKVCYSLSNFDFDMSISPWRRNSEAFKNYVSQVLTFHDDSDIHKFKLSFHYESDKSLPAFINQWISFVVNHNVRELQISIVTNQYVLRCRSLGNGRLPTLITFPPSVFICSTLTILFISATKLILPTNIKFPNLKDLTFELVQFVDDNDTKRLILSSTVLERLSISDCFWMNSHDFSTLLLPAPNLKVLKLRVDHHIQISSIKDLHQIWYSRDSPPHFRREDVLSVTEATFIFPNLSWASIQVTGHWQSEILLGLSNVEKLTILGWFIEYLSRELNLLARLPISCSTLKYLVLDFHPSIEQLKAVILLLRSYPCLQTLHICIEKLHLYEMLGIVDFGESRELATEAVLNRLTRVEIVCFEGSEMEFDLVRFLLRNATSLVIMNISLLPSIQRSSVSINDTLQTFDRVSRHAIISILDISPTVEAYSRRQHRSMI